MADLHHADPSLAAAQESVEAATIADHIYAEQRREARSHAASAAATATGAASAAAGGGGGGDGGEGEGDYSRFDGGTRESDHHENARSTLRVTSITKTTRDFYFEPWSVEESNCLMKCICKSDTIRSIFEAYGFKSVAALSSVYFCMKGVASQTLTLAYLPLLKDAFHVKSSTEQQQLTFAAQLAWPCKVLVGLVSDNFPIFGYRKRYYLVFFAVMAIISLILIFLLPTEQGWSVQVVAGLLFILNLSFAGADLLCEGAYSRFMVLKREAGSALISAVWFQYLIAGVVSAALVGPLSDVGQSKLIMLCLTPFVAVAVYTLSQNWLGERPLEIIKKTKRRHISDETEAAIMGATASDSHFGSTANTNPNPAASSNVYEDEGEQEVGGAGGSRRSASQALRGSNRRALSTYSSNASPGETSGAVGDNNETNDASAAAAAAAYISDSESMTWLDKLLPCLIAEKDPVKRNISIFSIVMGVIAPVSAAVSVSTEKVDPMIGFYFILSCIIFLSILATKLLPRPVCKAMIYMFTTEAFYIQITGPLGYWYTADGSCVPNGPEFSYTFYTSVTSIVSSIAGASGTWIFHRYLTKKTFRYCYIIAITLRVLASLFDLFIVTRTNIKLGLGDHVVYIFGDAACYQITMTLSYMASVMLTSAMCPPGLESSVYAVLAAFTTFGYAFSGTAGTALTKYFQIRTEENDCDFTNLTQMILLGHCILPLLGIPLVFFMIPNQLVTEPVTDEDGASGSGGGGEKKTEAQKAEERPLIDAASAT